MNIHLKRALIYYGFTFALVTFLFIIRDTDPRSVGVAGLYGFNSDTLFWVVVLSSVAALVMGLKNVRFKWLYPVSVSLFAYLVLPIITFFIYYQADSPFYFYYYLFLGFFYIFLVQIIATSLSLLLGVLIRKIRKKNEQHTKQE